MLQEITKLKLQLHAQLYNLDIMAMYYYIIHKLHIEFDFLQVISVFDSIDGFACRAFAVNCATI